MVKITPDIKVTDKILRKWTPAQRGCFFEDERFLKFFNIYTEKNCDLECEANISLSRCGCVPFYAPRTKGIPVCGPLKQPCVLESISKLLDPLSTGCNCKPSCFEINYKIDVAYYPRNWTTATTKGFKFEGVEQILENNYAHLTVQYQTQKVTAMKRIAVFGLSDFIANIGGLLGLFLGFSFLSLFEIFYFCTLRFKNKKGNSKMLPTNQHQMDADSLDKPQHEISQPTLHSILCVSSEVQAVTPNPSASPSRHLAPGPHSYVEVIQGSASVSVSNVNQVYTAGSGDGVASSNIPALEICPEKKQKL
ncbi:pickpocket protein 28-like [Macrosteles quadrilineatus]|uniref:pickpocket protein 28-like n=1 Tax=Macrosteles quadrilineatus TaxID=74068 RepID=UPI0023E2B1FF|nr:pickpocket protein 28-like [Macrosteles quadrilineatus]